MFPVSRSTVVRDKFGSERTKIILFDLTRHFLSTNSAEPCGTSISLGHRIVYKHM